MSPPKKKEAPSVARESLRHEPETCINAAPVNTGFDLGQVVPIVDGRRETEFDAEPTEVLAYLTPTERVTFELRCAAVRYVAGIEPRTFDEIGRELGVGRAAVSRVYRDVLARVGSLRVFDNAQKRWKLAEATRRSWANRKGAA